MAVQIEPQKLLIADVVIPRPVGLVSTVDNQGNVNAAPFSFYSPISYQPPLLYIAVGPKKHQQKYGYDPGRHPEGPETEKDTLLNIRETGDFVVNHVTEKIMHAIPVADKRYPRGVNEIRKANLTEAPSVKIRSPRIAEAEVAMECRMVDILHVKGHHVLVIGEVVLYHFSEELIEGGKVNVMKSLPVLHCGEDNFAVVKAGGLFKLKRSPYALD